MSKPLSIVVLSFMVVVATIMAYPLYRVYKEVNNTPTPAYHEYTVLDLETGKKMITLGDDNEHSYQANDTAWRSDRFLYEYDGAIPDNAKKVFVIASYNQLYQ